MRWLRCRVGRHPRGWIVPLYGLTDNEWDTRVVGHCCVSCGAQWFNGEPWFVSRREPPGGRLGGTDSTGG